MTVGKIDNEFAVREGWSRDSEDEIYMDGYNAFIQITTIDGTSGLHVKNDSGDIVFSSKSDGDGYFAKNLSVESKITTYSLKVQSGATSGYVLTSDTTGNATWQPIDASGLPPGTLDAYHPDVTGQEHYNQHSEAFKHILVALDGYSGGGGSADLSDVEEAIQTILKDLDGYHPDITGQEHYTQHSQAISTIRDSLDGYLSNVVLDGYLDDGYHRELDQLVHNIAEDSFEEITYSGAKVNSIIIYTDAGKTTKIREEQFTYTGNNVTQIVTIQYGPTGAPVETLTEALTYSGNKVINITRTLT